MGDVFFDIVFKPIWKWWVSMPLEIVGALTFINPDWGQYLNWPQISEKIAWYWWFIAGLILRGIGTALESAKRIKENSKNKPSVKSRAESGGQSLAIAGNVYGPINQTMFNNDDYPSEKKDANIIIEAYPRHEEGYASIRVRNREEDDIYDPSLKFIGAWKINKEEEKSILDHLTETGSEISQHKGKKDKVGGDSAVVFNVARCEDEKGGRFLFLMDSGSEIAFDEGLYKIEVAFSGRIGRNKTERKTKTCYLEYYFGIKEYTSEGLEDKIRRTVIFIDIRDEQNSTVDIRPWKQLDENAGQMYLLKKMVKILDDVKKDEENGK